MKSTSEIIQAIGEHTFIKAMEIAHLGYWEWNITDNTETWSDEQFRIFGYEPGEIEPTYDHFVQALHPEDRDRVLAAVKNTLDGKEPYNIQFRIIRPDKTERFILAQGEVYKDEGNNPERMVGIVLDNTERKMMHSKLNESRKRMETLINNTDDMICSRNQHRALLSWNRAFAESIKQAFGVEPYVGMRTVDYLSPDQKEQFTRFHELYDRVLSGEHIKEEFIYRLPDGNTNYYEIIWSPIRDAGEISGVAEVTRNITGKKLQEIELNKSNERVRAFMNNSTEDIYCFEFEQPLEVTLPEDEQVDHIYKYGYVAEANNSWARAAGFEDRKELLGLRFNDFLPRSRPESIASLKEYISNDFSLTDHETVEVYSNGVARYVLNNVISIKENGKIIRIWGSGRDITRQRQMEDELKRNKEDLQKLAGWLISRQEKEFSRIARELHDDLTQQLAVLAIEAGNIEARFSNLPESVLQKITHIKEQLIKTSKDVHHLSRDLHPSILYDLGLERAVRSECSNFSSRTGIAVVFEPRDVPVNIPEAISLAVYRIIQECLLNIKRHAKAKTAYVFLERCKGEVALTVRDTGAGYDHKEVGGRSALGLSSMRERVRLVNGQLSITSNPGKGTSVEVKIPLKGE